VCDKYRYAGPHHFADTILRIIQIQVIRHVSLQDSFKELEVRERVLIFAETPVNNLKFIIEGRILSEELCLV
jgi:hypothetical protein